jgi:hypothetical protein
VRRPDRNQRDRAGLAEPSAKRIDIERTIPGTRRWGAASGDGARNLLNHASANLALTRGAKGFNSLWPHFASTRTINVTFV